MGAPVVALVLVSHSRALAEGVAELAGQMAPDVALLPAGGTDDGGLGTGFDRILGAVETAVADGRSAVVLTDLGSAVLTTESVLEMVDPDVAARVRVADAPFVEGAVEAAVVAQGGAEVDAVHEAAEHAGAVFAEAARARAEAGAEAPTPHRAAPPQGPDGPAGPASTTPATAAGTARGTAVLRNRLGLHARPAASLARTAAAFASTITVNGADARSVLALVALNAVGGSEVVVAANGPDARTAVNAVVAELEEGFGEA
jgi:phosphoenolpyruvate---glycerone phosphotransferase subunit DhaM